MLFAPNRIRRLTHFLRLPNFVMPAMSCPNIAFAKASAASLSIINITCYCNLYTSISRSHSIQSSSTQDGFPYTQHPYLCSPFSHISIFDLRTCDTTTILVQFRQLFPRSAKPNQRLPRRRARACKGRHWPFRSKQGRKQLVQSLVGHIRARSAAEREDQHAVRKAERMEDE